MSIILNAATGQWENVPDDFSQIITLQADQSVISSTTEVALNNLVVGVGPRQRLQFEYYLHFNAGATGDFKYSLLGPTSPTALNLLHEQFIAAATGAASTQSAVVYNAYPSAVGVAGAAGLGLVIGRGILINAGTAGNLSFTFAQNASEAVNTTVKAGSFIKFKTF